MQGREAGFAGCFLCFLKLCVAFPGRAGFGVKNLQGVCRIADKIAGFMANAEAAGAPITYRETAKRSRSS